MDCDRIASLYQWLEYIAFGRALERRRRNYLSALADCKRILVLGDGDGRFLLELAKQNRHAHIDCFDLSPRMLEQSRKRLNRVDGLDQSRILLQQADALRVAYPRSDYDAVVTHFFLDCFSTVEVQELVGRVTPHCGRGALWVLSEFHQPAHGWHALHARCWLWLMYLFFRVATGLKTQQLPQYAAALASAGFIRCGYESDRAGLLCSEMWRLP